MSASQRDRHRGSVERAQCDTVRTDRAGRSDRCHRGTRQTPAVALTWTAPASNGGAAITDYTVQSALSPPGTSWTTFTHAASTATSITVTGLTNGQAYVFRVAAVNTVGTGSYSTTSAAVTPAGSGTWSLDFTDDALGISTGWTSRDAFRLGVANFSGTKKACTVDPGDGTYVDWYYTRSTYDTALCTSVNQTIRAEFEFGAADSEVFLWYRTNATQSQRQGFVVRRNGTWQGEYDGGLDGGSGSYTAPALNTPFTFEIVIGPGNAYVVKVNTTTITSGTHSNTRTGLYGGVSRLHPSQDVALLPREHLMAENLYPYGYSGTKLTWDQMMVKNNVKNLHPELLRRFKALIEHAATQGVPLGVGDGWRVQPDPPPPGFAQPGNSWHESCPVSPTSPTALAIDTVLDSSWAWMENNVAAFGLRSFRDVNDEPWHIQPVEIPKSRSYATVLPPLEHWALPGETETTSCQHSHPKNSATCTSGSRVAPPARTPTRCAAWVATGTGTAATSSTIRTATTLSGCFSTSSPSWTREVEAGSLMEHVRSSRRLRHHRHLRCPDRHPDLLNVGPFRRRAPGPGVHVHRRVRHHRHRRHHRRRRDPRP